MNCNEANDYIMKYLDKDFNDIESAQLKQHLKTCRSCQESFDALKEVFDVVESEAAIEPPQDFEVTVMNRIHAMESKHKKFSDSMLVFAYSFTTLLLTVISIVFMARFNGIDIWEVFRKTAASFNSVPEAVMTVVGIIGALYSLAVRLVEIVLQVLGMLVSNYYYVLAVLFIAFLMLQRVYVSFAKNARRDKH